MYVRWDTKSKAKDHIRHLDRRLKLSTEGDIESLIAEARCIQACINSRIKPTNKEEIARRFAKLMMIGKVNAALQILSTTGSVLNIVCCC